MTTTLTPDLLRQIMNCPADRAAECFPAMVSAMRTFQIDTPARITCFLTQVKWESGGLVYFAELASGDAYNGRADLGNTQPGDGPRYKGSGPIQVTGRSNFEAAQRALDTAGIGIDIVSSPGLARTVQYGFWISCWWWESHGGNAVASVSPLSLATIRCGRLVNRGDANSQSPAQNESDRIAAFSHVQQFGDLSLPLEAGNIPPVDSAPLPPAFPWPPVPPVVIPPTDWLTSVEKQEVSDLIDARLKASLDAIAESVISYHGVPTPVAGLYTNIGTVLRDAGTTHADQTGRLKHLEAMVATVGGRAQNIVDTLSGLAGAVKAAVKR